MENEIKKEARKLYYNYLVRKIRNIYLRDIDAPRLDMRYNKNRAIMSEFAKMMRSTNFAALWIKGHDKYMTRLTERKPFVFSNVLNNPIVIDYYMNRSQIKNVAKDCIIFHGGRNHWAKDKRDIRILAILAKNFQKYKEAQIC